MVLVVGFAPRCGATKDIREPTSYAPQIENKQNK